MDRYKNKTNDKIALVINDIASGMCDKTLGLTMVIYKYEGDTHEYPFIMEHTEFYNKHSKINQF